MKNDSDSFFWPSYVDLLTALFIVMLVLFVLSYKLLSDTIKATEAEIQRIKEIQNISKNLPQDYFEFESQFKRWNLKSQIQFVSGSAQIPNSDYEYLINVGNSLIDMIDSLKKNFVNDSLKFLIIIEGMSSRIGSPPDPNNLSYRRAHALFSFWFDNGIIFDPSICETIISGSGIYGIGRFKFDPPRFDEEKKNQRILIQVIPKTSDINTSVTK